MQKEKDDSLVSVIVPIYNTEKYLDECIDNIVRQTYKNLQIILVNDGSTDSSGKRCDEWKEQDERILVIHQKNKGLSAARNIGIDRSRGEWLVFIDSDDVVGSNYVLCLYELVQKYNVLIAQCERGDLQQRTEQSEKITDKVMKSNEFLISFQYQTTAWGKIYKKELFEKERYPVGKIHEDMAVTYKLVYAAQKIAVTNEILYFVRKRAGSITGKKKFYKERLDVLQFYKEQIEFYKEKKEKELVKRVRREYAYALLNNYSKTKDELGDKETALKLKKEYQGICFQVVREDEIISVKTRVLLVICFFRPEFWQILLRE